MKRILSSVSITVFLSLVLFLVADFALPVMPAQATSNPECWAVIVGIADYEKAYINDLLYPDDDARELSQLLEPVWGTSHIKLLVDSTATRDNILSAIDWLAENADTDDTILFYFSGWKASLTRARWDDSLGKWIPYGDMCPYDTGIKSYPRYYEYYNLIYSNELAELFQSVKAEKSIIIIESICASYFKYDMAEDGRVLLMSSKSGDTEHHSSEFKHSVFTYYILQAFENFDTADLNHDYELSAEEIFQYAEPKTTELYDDQHPVISDNYTGELALFDKFVFELNISLPYGTIILTLDGTEYTSAPPPKLCVPGISHTMSVPKIVDESANTRYVFDSWNDGNTSSSRVVTRGAYTTNYYKEHTLEVTSLLGETHGSDWYREGETVEFSVTDYIELADTKHYFTEWSGDYKGTSATASTVMSRPKEVDANWRHEYLLTLNSEYGEPIGAGWYKEGQSASISVAPVQGFIVRRIFDGWSGDFSSTSVDASVTMNSPKVITASWRTDYIQLYILIGGGVVLAGAIVATVLICRKMHAKRAVP